MVKNGQFQLMDIHLVVQQKIKKPGKHILNMM